MEIPEALRAALEQQIQAIEQSRLVQEAGALSLRYRTQSGAGERLLTSDSEAVAYAAARMPATYGAVLSVLEATLAMTDSAVGSVLDVGAGTGAGSWAADTLLDLQSITCLEREAVMRRIGQEMMRGGSPVLQKAEWRQHDLTKDTISEQADLVIVAYVLNEMTAEARAKTVSTLWDAAKQVLLLVEPGTPAGFANLHAARRILLERGAHIAAPCAQEGTCPLPQDDWCHFTCRVPRSRVHRIAKGGDAPFEDEKFSYLALSREECRHAEQRVLRHPQIFSGYVTLSVCTEEGIQGRKLSKKDGERYKRARKAQAGDAL